MPFWTTVGAFGLYNGLLQLAVARMPRLALETRMPLLDLLVIASLVLIEEGSYSHPWLGISGGSLVPDLAEAMGLDRDQRGALVATVAEGSPAAEAGLRPSEEQVTIEGVEAQVGGDVIVAIEGEPVLGFDDLITYLARNVEVGDTVELSVSASSNCPTSSTTCASRLLCCSLPRPQTSSTR